MVSINPAGAVVQIDLSARIDGVAEKDMRMFLLSTALEEIQAALEAEKFDPVAAQAEVAVKIASVAERKAVESEALESVASVESRVIR